MLSENIFQMTLTHRPVVYEETLQTQYAIFFLGRIWLIFSSLFLATIQVDKSYVAFGIQNCTSVNCILHPMPIVVWSSPVGKCILSPHQIRCCLYSSHSISCLHSGAKKGVQMPSVCTPLSHCEGAVIYRKCICYFWEIIVTTVHEYMNPFPFILFC